MKSLLSKKTACSSAFSGVLLILQHIFLIFLSSVCSFYFFPLAGAWSLLFYLVVVFFIGSRMRALGNIVHECAHNAFVPLKSSNAIIGKILCQMEFSCFETYRKDHFSHHRYLGNHEKDPDFKTYLEIKSSIPGFLLNTDRGEVRWYIFYAACLPLNWFKMLRKAVYIQRSELIFHLIYLLFLIIFSVVVGYQFFFCFFVVPFLSSYQALKIFSDMMDHDVVYFFPDMRYKSCNHAFSVSILNWVFFPRNDAYHLVHHLFPKEPTTVFPQLHQKLLKDDDIYSKQKHVIL